jgi:hypothetical protein
MIYPGCLYKMITKQLILIIHLQYNLMQSVNKARIATVVGIGIIVFVASLVGLPFMSSDSGIQKTAQKSINKVDDSEEKLLDFIQHEKAELESKVHGKVNFP